jgi:hypothetical protein
MRVMINAKAKNCRKLRCVTGAAIAQKATQQNRNNYFFLEIFGALDNLDNTFTLGAACGAP